MVSLEKMFLDGFHCGSESKNALDIFRVFCDKVEKTLEIKTEIFFLKPQPNLLVKPNSIIPIVS